MNFKERAEKFATYHRKGDPLILFNIWDAGSARALQEAGARALATGSWSVATAHGYADGEKLPMDLAIANLRRIVASVDLPVTLDFEGGYSDNPEGLRRNIARVLEAGAVGINFEDQVVGGSGLFEAEAQCARIRAIREEVGLPFFINARSDVFLKSKPADHSEEHVEAALQRAVAYAQAGASGFFPPGVRRLDLIETICRRSPLPVNILVYPEMGVDVSKLAKLGVARISHGPFPYRMMMEALKEAARAALSGS